MGRHIPLCCNGIDETRKELPVITKRITPLSYTFHWTIPLFFDFLLSTRVSNFFIYH